MTVSLEESFQGAIQKGNGLLCMLLCMLLCYLFLGEFKQRLNSQIIRMSIKVEPGKR